MQTLKKYGVNLEDITVYFYTDGACAHAYFGCPEGQGDLRAVKSTYRELTLKACKRCYPEPLHQHIDTATRLVKLCERLDSIHFTTLESCIQAFDCLYRENTSLLPDLKSQHKSLKLRLDELGQSLLKALRERFEAELRLEGAKYLLPFEVEGGFRLASRSAEFSVKMKELHLSLANDPRVGVVFPQADLPAFYLGDIMSFTYQGVNWRDLEFLQLPAIAAEVLHKEKALVDYAIIHRKLDPAELETLKVLWQPGRNELYSSLQNATEAAMRV